jgi:hypothetical protein
MHVVLGRLTYDFHPEHIRAYACVRIPFDLGRGSGTSRADMEVFRMINTPVMPLDFWRQEIGYSPWHFWGLADTGVNAIAPVTSRCNDIVYEHSWQGTDEAGRADIRAAMMTAEKILFDNLNYWPAPVYSEDTLPWPRFIDKRLYRTAMRDAMGGWIPVRLNEGYIQNTGIETLVNIGAGSALVYTDEDGDGLADTFTVTLAVTVTEPDEIALYFTAADRLDDDDEIQARWRIEPVHVQIAAGVATIKGKRWLVVKPVLYEKKENYPIDPTVAANFITTCDVYRRYTYRDGQVSYTNSQAALIYETKPCSWCCSTVTNSTDPTSEGWVAARAGIRDSYNGIVVPAEATYNATTGAWSHSCHCLNGCGEPDRVLVRYLAGVGLDAHGWMQKSMRTLVSRLAAAEMTRRICACDQANREWSNWQFDVSRVNAPEVYQINLDILSNPLGTRRGHIYAWQQIKSLARVVGMLA